MPRLSKHLVEHIARKMADRLEELTEEVQLKGDRQAIETHFIEAFMANFAEEEELEAEARRLIDLHLRGQSRDSVNYAETLRKSRKELARKRGFAL